MRVLLVEPPKSPLTIGGEDVFCFEPLALEYIAAGAAPEHDVRILDLRFGGHLASCLAAYAPDVVGFTGYTVHVNVILRLAREVKAWRRDVLTVVGGHHATVAPADFASPAIDLVVVGDGINAFRDILRRHEVHGNFAGIPGVTSRPGEEVVSPVLDPGLDAAPHPRRELTAAHRKDYYCDWMRPLASMRTSRGCPFRCRFCAEWKVAGGRYFRRAPEAIIEELSALEEEWVFFADDESLVDTTRMRLLASLISDARLGKRLFLYGRSDTIAAHPDLLEAWRRAGLERVFVGLEFSRDEDLAFIRKHSTSADNERAVRVLKDLDIDVYASFMVRPEFTRDDFTATRRYCRRLGLDFATFAVLTPLPGTDLYADVHERMLTHEPDYFDFVHTLLPTALPLPAFYRELQGLYRNAVPITRQLALLRRYPLRDLPGVLGRGNRALTRLGEAWRDYPPAAA